MGLTTSGIFSGINTDDVVSKLMQVERQPLVKLQKTEAEYQSKISGLGSLLSSMTGLKNAVAALKDSNLLAYKATPSDPSIFTATTASGASAAVHSVKITNIASAQSTYSTTFTNTTDPVADLSSFATQKMQIQVGSGAIFTITVDATNNTLTGIKDAINNAKADVTASIVNDGTGNRLVLTSKNTGAANTIKIKVDENNDGLFEQAGDGETDAVGLSKLAFNPASYDGSGSPVGGVLSMSQSMAAKDASLIVDGLTVTKSSNTISDVIAGVTLSLKKDSAGSTLTLDVSKDIDSIKTKIQSFVTVYNQVMSSIKDLEGTKDKQGTLPADSTIYSLKATLRSVISNTYSNSSLTLLGLTHDKTGALSFSASTFDTQSASDLQGALSTINSMATSLDSTLDTYVKNVIPDKQNSYSATAKLLSKKEENMQLRLDKVEKDLKKKFNDLDSIMQKLQGQSTYLTQQFSALNSRKE